MATAKNKKPRKYSFSLRTLYWKIKHVLIFIVTASYAGALHSYTLEPIHLLYEYQNNDEKLRLLLCAFRKSKERELEFVRTGATLAAAAVVGAKSWPDVSLSFWLVRVSWNISLWCSICSLISSVPQRLLEQLPASKEEADILDRAALVRLVLIALKPMPGVVLRTVQSPDKRLPVSVEPAGAKKRAKAVFLIWVWQCHTMLMSFAWVFFVLGYMLYNLTPLIQSKTWGPETWGSLISAIIGAVCGVNYFLTGAIASATVRKIRADVSE